jgi:hypothetical protein
MKSAKQWFEVAFAKEDKEFFFSGTEGDRLKAVFIKMFSEVQEDALSAARLIVLNARKKFTKNFTRPISPETDLFADEFKEALDKLIEKSKQK